jgi:hypothetical protein
MSTAIGVPGFQDAVLPKVTQESVLTVEQGTM